MNRRHTAIRLCLWLLLSAAGNGYAQLTDDFSDGDFTANPAWSGDDGDFTVNASQQLQLNAAAAGMSYLAVSAPAAALDNQEWQCYIRLDFSPSANNNARVYLASDQHDLSGSLNGYFLQFGENLSNDAIELFRQTGTSTVSVARGTDGFIAAPFMIRVKVTRDAAGLWSLYADPAGGTAFALQATGTDATYNQSAFFGVYCKYTVSNIAGFYFDDFVVPLVADTDPPGIQSVTATGPQAVDVLFDEPVDQATAETASNYDADGGLGMPATAVRDASDYALVHLGFATAFQSGQLYTLDVMNVQDLSANVMAPGSGTFTYTAPVVAAPYDLVINEVYFQPSSTAALPDAEFVELYNRSSKTFDLTGWTLADKATAPAVFGAATLPPGGYLLVCDDGDAGLLSPYGPVAGLPGFPGLNNDSDYVVVRDGNGVEIDRLQYDASYYNDPDRDGGGYSIERVDPDFTCPNKHNWRASLAVAGGTPGALNSVDGTFADAEAPRLARAFLSAANAVTVVFSEAMDAAQLSDPANYSVDNGFGVPASATATTASSAALSFTAGFDSATTYTVTAAAGMKDCPGNALSETTARFRAPEDAALSDVLINEVLYHPYSGGSEFIELYNRSERVIDLGRLRLAEVDIATNDLKTPLAITAVPWLLFPGSYVVLADDAAAVTAFYETPDPDAFIDVANFPSLNDDEDAVALVDLSAQRIDQFHYDDGYQFALLQDPQGVSLERISFDRPTQDSTNWHSAAASAGFATPAYENSQHAEAVDDGSEVSVSPEVFSPDNDGRDDVVHILYHFDAPGYVANLRIYDARGREVIYLVRNEPLGVEGSFSWDGLTAGREKAGVGIYVMYLEVFNTAGSVKKFKKPLVLAGKL